MTFFQASIGFFRDKFMKATLYEAMSVTFDSYVQNE